MKRILIFAASVLISVGGARAAVRDGNAAVRQKSPSTAVQRTTTTEKTLAPRTSVLAPRAITTSSRAATNVLSRGTAATTSRAATNVSSRGAAANSAAPARTTVARGAITTPVSARAATNDNTATMSMSETRTGAAYEKCKNAYFTCMDQFCTLKNDDYRRCSCSNRVYNLADQRQVLQDAGEKLTVFTENLDVVGMTAAQATAMKTASEGENALTSDSSASKALLQAIMNSIRGTDSSVGGKYSDLNSINISFNTANAFGMTDAGQAIAAYNGQNLYSAVYPQCRNAVKADCNDASLQRAITAYLMAVEQDCNTLETAIAEKQKQMKSAVREGSAMLDLARVENRQKHNSDDIATCVANVETAILSEEVCGANYHKCLDNGEFIDISTGAPIAGVANFYKLEQLLKFPDGVDAADQKLTRVNSNRIFVQNFEKRVKKFAQPALDKCTEQADTVWAEYLDKAMLDIYYAQKAKVAEIRQGCFDFVSACYMNGDKSITDAMKELTGEASVVVQPDRIVLNDQMCTDYINSCNGMFDNDIIKDYIAKRTDTDTLTACRAVVKQCFDKYGGSRYENFYYPYSGLFKEGQAPDWFTLYEITGLASDAEAPGSLTVKYGDGIDTYKAEYKSECAKQLTTIPACNNQKIIEAAFGGFDKIKVTAQPDPELGQAFLPDLAAGAGSVYGTLIVHHPIGKSDEIIVKHRNLRPTGVATEIYNQIIDSLSTQCMNIQGRFVEYQFIRPNIYDKDNFCLATFGTKGTIYADFVEKFKIGDKEDMCPRDYGLNVDTQSWGACLCWENGGRRSKWGKSAKCVAALPVEETQVADEICAVADAANGGKEISVYPDPTFTPKSDQSIDNWCTIPSNFFSSENQICLDSQCKNAQTNNMPKGITE